MSNGASFELKYFSFGTAGKKVLRRYTILNKQLFILSYNRLLLNRNYIKYIVLKLSSIIHKIHKHLVKNCVFNNVIIYR